MCLVLHDHRKDALSYHSEMSSISKKTVENLSLHGKLVGVSAKKMQTAYLRRYSMHAWGTLE